VLTRAYLTALGGRLDELAAEALALRLSLRSRRQGGTAKALEDLDVAREMVARLPPQNRVHGLLLNNAGNVYMATGDVEKATTMFREALAACESALGPDHVDVAYTLFNLSIVTPPGPERMQLVRRTLEILDKQLGPAHPQNLELRLHSSHFALDPREALALVAPACDTLARFTPDDHALRARCSPPLGHHAAEAGDTAAATAAFREAEAQLDATDIALPARDLVALRGEAALYTGRSAAVLDSLRAAIAPTVPDDEPWQRQERGDFELLLGQNLQRLADHPAAGTALAAALADYEAIALTDIPALQRLAAARLALADHLSAHPTAPADPERAATLRLQARQWYAQSGPGYAWRLAANAP
jgi:tetratricopeptide (TPR) repeat protein